MVSERLKKVILKALDLDEFDLKETTLASAVPGWDSLSHVRVVTAVESEYRIRLTTIETLRLKCVGDLQALIDKKTDAV
jgi:acyl carrier protein